MSEARGIKTQAAFLDRLFIVCGFFYKVFAKAIKSNKVLFGDARQPAKFKKR